MHWKLEGDISIHFIIIDVIKRTFLLEKILQKQNERWKLNYFNYTFSYLTFLEM